MEIINPDETLFTLASYGLLFFAIFVYIGLVTGSFPTTRFLPFSLHA